MLLEGVFSPAKRHLAARIVSSIILIVGIFAVIFNMPAWAFTVLVAVFAFAGLFEFYVMSEIKGISVARSVAIPCGVLISISPSFFWDEVLLVSSMFFLFIYHFTKREERPATFLPIASSLFGWIYIGWFMSFFNKIRLLPEGNLWLCFALFVAKAGDMGAFLIGSRWGRTPLIPRISPKKSVEGAIGGLAVSFFVAVIFAILIQKVPFWHALFLGILVGIVAQLGDLSESLIKREVGVKDAGGLIPGLGGVLDLVDSLLFTAPLVYLYLVLILFR